MSVTITISCPHYQETDKIIRFGSNRSGTARCRCHTCGKTFTLDPKSQTLSPEKEASILNCLAEQISHWGIARSLRVSRLTHRNLRKKRRANNATAMDLGALSYSSFGKIALLSHCCAAQPG